MDFVHDQLAMGQKIRPVIDPRFSYRAQDVVMTLERTCRQGGYPKTIRVDQGSEFVSRELDLWAYMNGVTLDFSRPGKPTDNAFIEAFNSKLRSECLNAHWFMSLDDARSKMEEWRRYYNEERPHSGIGQMTPVLLHNPGDAASPSSRQEAENSSLG
jgi:putative transposase